MTRSANGSSRLGPRLQRAAGHGRGAGAGGIPAGPPTGRPVRRSACPDGDEAGQCRYDATRPRGPILTSHLDRSARPFTSPGPTRQDQPLRLGSPIAHQVVSHRCGRGWSAGFAAAANKRPCGHRTRRRDVVPSGWRASGPCSTGIRIPRLATNAIRSRGSGVTQRPSWTLRPSRASRGPGPRPSSRACQRVAPWMIRKIPQSWRSCACRPKSTSPTLPMSVMSLLQPSRPASWQSSPT
jgi:hypothetical protein